MCIHVYTVCTCTCASTHVPTVCNYMYVNIHDNTEMRERKKERKTPEANEK